ncbi:MAG TPA: AAA family ATPase, partial [Kofleriaceae bacterium]|nr:AAA family ATPase [Kofleriaceae bacterium]
VEIVHESLIQSWPMLRRWLDETQEDAAFLEQLRNAAKQWQAKGHAPDLLWRGEAMREAKHWHSRYRGELPELQRRYLTAVFDLSARSARRKRLAVIGAMGFLATLAVAASVGLVMIRDAQKEATAQARRVEDQLTLTRAAETTAREAEKIANAERSKAVAANQKLESQNASLVAAIDDANLARLDAERARILSEKARRRAERSKHQEQQSRERATEAARRASVAAAQAKRASEKLEELLTAERKRVQELEAQTKGLKIVQQLSLE